MNTEELLKHFKEILTLEERVKNFYEHYIDQLEDADIKKQLTAIRNDEIKHIGIAKELISMVS